MVEGRACTHSEFRLQASKVKRLESLSRPPCYNEVVSSLGRSAFLLSMSQIDAIDIGARETSQESGHSANDSTRRFMSTRPTLANWRPVGVALHGKGAAQQKLYLLR
jgi:hypothetical protein